MLKPDISIYDPPLYIYFRKTVFSVYKFCTCVYHPLWHSHSLTHSHNCVCMGVWVCLCYTHTLTHTPAPQTTCLIDTFCAQKKFTFVKLFYQVFKPLWYFFQLTTIFGISLSLSWLHLFFVCTKIFRKTWVFQIFLERKIGKRVYYIQQDIVNKYLFFHILLQKLQVILYFLFHLHIVFPISVAPSGHYSVLKKIFKCCTK